MHSGSCNPRSREAALLRTLRAVIVPYHGETKTVTTQGFRVARCTLTRRGIGRDTHPMVWDFPIDDRREFRMETTSFFKSSAGVFQGGGCRAAAFVGAYSEAIRRGVSFAEVAGTSAGSIVAALVGGGANPDDLRSAIAQLDFHSFLRAAVQSGKRSLFGKALELAHPQFANLLYDQGFYSSSQFVEWINENLNKLLPLAPHPVAFRSLPIPTYIVSTDLTRFWSWTIRQLDPLSSKRCARQVALPSR